MVEAETTIAILIVEIGGERYALPSASVHEIVRHRPWTVVPGAPPALPGIISQRGLILPIVEMRALLGLPETEPDRATRFVIVQYADIDMALLVDRVVDLATVAESIFTSFATGSDSRRGRFVRAVAQGEDRPLALLDLAVMITSLREGY